MKYIDEKLRLEVGSMVTHTHHSHLRIGVVTDKMIDSAGWAQYKVHFFEDEQYQNNKEFQSQLSGKDEFQHTYQGTQIRPISPEWLKNVVRSYGAYPNER